MNVARTAADRNEDSARDDRLGTVDEPVVFCSLDQFVQGSSRRVVKPVGDIDGARHR
jgi:hypothetical protein